MFVPLLRSLILFLCTASAFATSGRAPGAVQLRTRDIEAAIVADARCGRDGRSESGWIA